MMGLSPLRWVGCALLACSTANALANEDAQEFRAAKPGIQRQLRSKKPEDRAAAIRRLQGFPLLEAVKMAMKTGFSDDSPAVQTATFETLAKLNENEEICKYLISELSRRAKKNDLGMNAVPVLAALLSSKSEYTEQAVTDFLDKTLDKAKGGSLVVTELADQLGARDEEDSLPVLVKLTKTKVFEHHFGPRRAVVWALIRLDRLDSLGVLIELLSHIKGEVRADIVKYLTAVTGQNFLENPQAWTTWWDKNKESFIIPAPAARSKVESVAGEGTPYYYGVPIYAQKIVFVMDTSGSMAGFRLAAAKRELTETIEKLREDDEFAIIVFNSNVDAWQKKLVPATQAFKRAAISFVNGQVARSNTASYDALDSAFHFDAEAIYFLSDGAPQGGSTTNNPEEIVQLISDTNRTRRESIYSLGIAVGIPNSPFDLFLKALAEENFGSYRRVDQ